VSGLSFPRSNLSSKHLLKQIRNGPIFAYAGSNKDWSLLGRIHKIKVPTLLINGKYDGAQDSVMEPFFESIEKVKWVRFAESSHFPQMEEPEEYLKVVSGFLLMK
jgi:L-proline amide hydrolase